VSVAHHPPIDGYDWGISTDTAPACHPRELADARRRARAWRKAQPPHGLNDRATAEGIAPVPAGDPGWVHIGHVIEWDGQRLRILWHPKADAVRVAQRPPAPAIVVPAPPPLPPPAPPPIHFHVHIRRRLADPVIRVRLRHLPGPGQEGALSPLISFTLGPPPDMPIPAWDQATVWTERLAHDLLMRPTLLDTPPAGRLPLYQAAMYALIRAVETVGVVPDDLRNW